ncbi:MAG: ABC transporter permease [Bacteroidales bacterium]|nr:ABC transporter permease [Bacteroidales bacterium]
MGVKHKDIERIKTTLRIALEAVVVNKVRTFLTALGIIFGVAAVISMLAIGNGAKKEVLDQMKLIGVNNIVINAKKLDNIDNSGGQTEASQEEKDAKSKENLSAGLNLKEAESIKEVIPTVKYLGIETSIESTFMFSGKRINGSLSGVNDDFYKVYQLELEKGYFPAKTSYIKAAQICVIGYNLKSKLFPKTEAVGNDIKCGNSWYKIVGVLEQRGQSSGLGDIVSQGNFDMTVFIPLQSYLKRHNDMSKITERMLEDSDYNNPNRNQIGTIIVQVYEASQLKATAEIANRLLSRKHSGAKDYTVTVPELLLKQEQKTRSIFNIVLGAIASISLIVGGIGIMNIMLASVMERTKEIGIRRSIGATAKDVVFQFLAEASIISLFGGLVGVFLGVALAYLISFFTEISTIVSWFSILVSFFVSAGVGIVFGYMPAQKAAKEDIVVALRYE